MEFLYWRITFEDGTILDLDEETKFNLIKKAVKVLAKIKSIQSVWYGCEKYGFNGKSYFQIEAAYDATMNPKPQIIDALLQTLNADNASVVFLSAAMLNSIKKEIKA